VTTPSRPAPTGTRALVDTEVSQLLDIFPTAVLSHEILDSLRNADRLPFPPAEGRAAEVTRQVFEIPGPKDSPEVGVIVYSPPDADGPVGCILHIHGGGYVLGAAAPQEPVHRTWVAELGCVVVTVEYRLAPETRAPGNVEDCYAALAWTVANAERLGIDPARIGVMGESAGGGLSAALALLARDRGEYRLAFQHLIYPMLDDRTVTRPDPNPYVGEFIWTPHNNHFGWAAILGVEPGSDGVSPYAAPARAEDLTGLPPTFISTGALDLFLEEDLDYARRLLRAGVPVELHVYPGGPHAFDFHPTAGVSVQARRDSLAALSRFLR
jgi:acetyl esterase/lipase